MTILVTGGCGFIGSNFIHRHAALFDEPIINIDNHGFAANPDNLLGVDKCLTINLDINEQNAVAKILNDVEPRAIIHFAAESHVDRSIESPRQFILSNVLGTGALLEVAHDYWKFLKVVGRAKDFTFIHVSTDEVYGSLRLGQDKFTETSVYDPHSPYAASKAASDHIVSSWYHTYGFPAIITNCSNNYGPRQHKEKFIPTVINSILQEKKVPIYGNGQNVRDWIFVDDHNAAIQKVLEWGIPGQKYNIGANMELDNLTLAQKIATLMGVNFEDAIEFVTDRPGHDFRYAINNTKIMRDLLWFPSKSLRDGLVQTIKWYTNENTRNNLSSGQ